MPPAPAFNTLSRAEARRVYDRIGRRQDSQGFYEDPATEIVVAHAELGSARSVVELGCGTGRFAEALLDSHLPSAARYRGFDLSPEMVRLANERLARFGDRATVALTDGDPRLPLADGSCDRYLSNYVLDLMSEEEMGRALADAARLVGPGGLLGLASLTHGFTWRSRWVMRLWRSVYRRDPARLGGCRPVELERFLPERLWQTVERWRIDPWGIPSEVLVARRRG